MPKKVLKHLTVQSLVFSGSLTVKRIETVAVHSTIDTQRNDDSRKTCSNDEHVALNQEISRLTAENLQFRQADSSGMAEIATAVGQAAQIAISNATPRSNERQSLVDIKGLRKPPTFKGQSVRLIEWLRKTMEYLIAPYGSAFRPVTEWMED